ncbi:MAG: hypothetical protein KDA89_14970 [Planctomycetaceae bacterium]|nr:hypothetical protein [Planctomycetaceae bacterium]
MLNSGVRLVSRAMLQTAQTNREFVQGLRNQVDKNMQPKSLHRNWLTAAVLLLSASAANAQQGVVRLSDTNSQAGVVRLGQSQGTFRPTAQPAAFSSYRYGGQQMPAAAVPGPQSPQNHAAQPNYPAQQSSAPAQRPGAFQNASWPQPVGPGPHQAAAYQAGPTVPVSWSSGGGGCMDGSCYGGYGWDSGSCDNCEMCDNGGSCDTCYGSCQDECMYGCGHQQRMCRLFAGATPPDGCTRWPRRWWRGQCLNFSARNQRLSNHLFGWMVPSGCCGQGCPPVGKYCVTYADDPGYADPRDTQQAYGAQGYGVPVTVPLAPNVRHSYNYSWGMPASRVTPQGSYVPQGTYQPLYHQTW